MGQKQRMAEKKKQVKLVEVGQEGQPEKESARKRDD